MVELIGIGASDVVVGGDVLTCSSGVVGSGDGNVVGEFVGGDVVTIGTGGVVGGVGAGVGSGRGVGKGVASGGGSGPVVVVVVDDSDPISTIPGHWRYFR